MAQKTLGIKKTTKSSPKAYQVFEGVVRDILFSPQQRTFRVNIDSQNKGLEEREVSFLPSNAYYEGIPVYVDVPKLAPANIWMLESLFSKEQVLITLLRRNRVIDTSFVKDLLKENHLVFYLNSNKTFLLANNSELFQNDFGKLTKINGIAAFKQFGIEKLEEAKEKGYVRL